MIWNFLFNHSKAPFSIELFCVYWLIALPNIKILISVTTLSFLIHRNFWVVLNFQPSASSVEIKLRASWVGGDNVFYREKLSEVWFFFSLRWCSFYDMCSERRFVLKMIFDFTHTWTVSSPMTAPSDDIRWVLESRDESLWGDKRTSEGSQRSWNALGWCQMWLSYRARCKCRREF